MIKNRLLKMSDSNLLAPIYFFLHIPKTGGVSIKNNLSRVLPKSSVYSITSNGDGVSGYFGYLSSLKKLEDYEQFYKDKIRLVTGHYSFGLHESFGDRTFKYLSFVRDPIERVISLYFYIKTQPTHPLFSVVVDKNLTLEQFALGSFHSEIENCQTKMLSGRKETDFLVGTEPCAEIDLQRAIKHIESYFPVVGLTEKCDQSLSLINYNYGLNLVPGVKKNVTKYRPKITEIDQVTKKAIESVNAYDIELYRYSCERFQKMIKSQRNQLFLLSTSQRVSRKLSRINCKIQRILSERMFDKF
ncbi:sulfotransferase family 2 domain-containing protein [Sphaerospermopsis sp. FACHB-1194]|uniref:sulfotransferase family 2 domain-containing protein n=1 Tax=Sphaerospermopsis sp. FACHB-1194 TaxID=2692862 RepID=UPI0016801FC1|nr:sulfotransferase family 2 domain-containing protein [Sphaerospermopsis sp. FACHB-1194]MBD2147212.1 sulfotransferase family 2 domain-containing protein [Sphaerospermopsis sp. FACHB-1194]